jgi:hypothetical protein
VLINCICSAQTNKHKREDEKEGGRAGAEEDVRVEPRTTQKCFYSRGGGAVGAPGAALLCIGGGFRGRSPPVVLDDPDVD